jgi:hypothetical protein
MSNNLIDILNLVNLTETYDVYVPSIKSYFKFKPVIIEQYRNFINSVANNPYFNIGFQQELTTLIKANIVDTDVNVSLFTEIDKLAIALAIRINDISSTYNDIDLTFLKEKIEQLFIPEQTTIFKDGVTVICNIPTLSIEDNFNRYAEKNLDEEVKEATALKDIIDLMFISEIAKCITVISVNNETYTQHEDFETWLKAVSNLPISLLNDALKYVDSIKAVKDTLLKVNDTDSLVYDLSLFTSV